MFYSLESLIDTCKEYASLNEAERQALGSIVTAKTEEERDELIRNLTDDQLSALYDFSGYIPSRVADHLPEALRREDRQRQPQAV